MQATLKKASQAPLDHITPKVSLYRTSNAEYGTKWMSIQNKEEMIENQNDAQIIQQEAENIEKLAEYQTQQKLLASDIPNYYEIGLDSKDYARSLKLLKNQNIAQKYSKAELDGKDENQRLTQKLMSSTVASKKFPVDPSKPDEIKYPEHGLNIGKALYKTSYMNIGKLKPSQYEITEKYFPRDAKFTQQFSGGNYKFNGLNTAFSHSKVHNTQNEF